MKYYAVKAGKTPGIFDNWSDCSESVKGFTNADLKLSPVEKKLKHT
jgi:ribonuclease HI